MDRKPVADNGRTDEKSLQVSEPEYIRVLGRFVQRI